MKILENKHKDQTAWIIGKGPSLGFLKKEDIGEGIIITIKQAIIAIESLSLSNPIYSLQKDGGPLRKSSKNIKNLCPDCDHSANCGDSCGNGVRPSRAALLLHDLESKYCFLDYPKRHVFNLQKLGLEKNVFSLIFALKIAQYMGCNKINFVSCDVHAVGVYDSYTPGKGLKKSDPGYAASYHGQRIGMKSFIDGLDGLDYKWITPGQKKEDNQIAFGVMVNNLQRLDMCLKQSGIDGEMHYVKTPESATKGLNKLLDIIESEGSDIAVLTHQDMFYLHGWIEQVTEQIELLPESWIVAGIIGKDNNGGICGVLHDTRIPLHFNTTSIHEFPHPACCFDECCIIVNIKSGFRFDETMDGFDLYGTLAVIQATEMGGTAWILNAFAEHYCMRPFTWTPDETFKKNYKWLWDRFNEFGRVDSTAIGLPKETVDRIAFMRSAA